MMGHDKRKGKELVVEPPKKKKTRTQKEAERAAMAARATDDQAASRFVSVPGLEEGTLSVRIRV
jgi:hypothetical protein